MFYFKKDDSLSAVMKGWKPCDLRLESSKLDWAWVVSKAWGLSEADFIGGVKSEWRIFGLFYADYFIWGS